MTCRQTKASFEAKLLRAVAPGRCVFDVGAAGLWPDRNGVPGDLVTVELSGMPIEGRVCRVEGWEAEIDLRNFSVEVIADRRVQLWIKTDHRSRVARLCYGLDLLDRTARTLFDISVSARAYFNERADFALLQVASPRSDPGWIQSLDRAMRSRVCCAGVGKDLPPQELANRYDPGFPGYPKSPSFYSLRPLSWNNDETGMTSLGLFLERTWQYFWSGPHINSHSK